MRGKRLHRLLQIIALLRGPTSWNARRLADHFHISRRNFHRDMAILELAGVPYFYDPDHGEGGGYRIRPEWWFPHVGLTNQECLDLAVLTRVAETSTVPLVDSAIEVRDKLLATLPPKQQDLIVEASELFEILTLGLANHGHCRQTMITLQQALLAKRQVSGTYGTPHGDKAKRVSLQPLRVFLCGQAWYLAAHDNTEGKVKLYRLARFIDLKLTDKEFTVEQSCSLRELLGNAWTVHRGPRDWHIEILFNKEAGPLVAETRWHHTQELIQKPDGSVLFRGIVSGFEEIKWWILGWGPRAIVLKPQELAAEVRQLATQAAANYTPSDSGNKTRKK